MPLLLQRAGELMSPWDALKAQAAARPHAVFLRFPMAAELPFARGGGEFSYAEVFGLADLTRKRFAEAGYGRGACVAQLLETRQQFFWYWLALNALGVLIMPINPDLRVDDLAYQLSVAEPDLVVALPETHALIANAWGGKALSGDDSRIISPVSPSIPSCRVRVTRQTAERDDPCALLFTSGTTAQPKCCVLSNDYFLRIAAWYVTQGGAAAMGDSETVLTPLPMFHMNALGCTVTGMLLTGGTVVPLDRFHARRWWRTVKESGATVIHYLGVMPAILLQLEKEAAETAHSVRFGFGAGVDPRHQESFERRFGFQLIEAWAMTETGAGAVTSTAVGRRHVGQRCIGRAARDMDWRIVDDAGAHRFEERRGGEEGRSRGAPDS